MAATPGPALECDNCMSVTPVGRPADFDECPVCGADTTTAVTLSACDARADQECHHDDHHFGLDMHVTGPPGR